MRSIYEPLSFNIFLGEYTLVYPGGLFELVSAVYFVKLAFYSLN